MPSSAIKDLSTISDDFPQKLFRFDGQEKYKVLTKIFKISNNLFDYLNFLKVT